MTTITRQRPTRVRSLVVAQALPRQRVLFLMTAMGLIAGVLAFRLASFQLNPPERYVDLAENQSRRALVLPASRGSIVDRNGLEMVVSAPAQTLVVDPRELTDVATAAAQIAGVLGLDPVALTARLSEAQAKKRAFEYIARQVDDEEAAFIKALEIPGLFTINEPKRLYPGGQKLAAPLLGTTDVDGVGIGGIERQYNQVLQGRDGKRIARTTTDGRTIPGDSTADVPAIPGSSVVLSIDRPLQLEVESILARRIDELGASYGIVVISEVGTSRILANAVVKRDPGSTARPVSENRALTWAFEPGSIMKAITASAIIDSGTATPESTKEITAKTKIYDVEFVDDTWHPAQTLSLAEIVEHSSNVGVVTWAQEMFKKIDISGYYSYLTKFGLGTSTGLGFPGESPGYVGNYKSWNGVYPYSTAFGQGATATPMQMLMALNTIANGGRYVAPQYVLGRTNPDGSFVPERPSDERQVISPESAKSVLEILQRVVASGTATAAKIDGFTVAGKTGTAWKPQENPLPGDSYRDSNGIRHLAPSFMGVLPAENPQISIMVVVDDVTNPDWTGGKVAAPIFSEIGEIAARQLRLGPTTDAPVTNGRVRANPELPPVRYDPALDAAAPPTSGPIPVTVTVNFNVTTVKGAPATTVKAAPAPATSPTPAPTNVKAPATTAVKSPATTATTRPPATTATTRAAAPATTSATTRPPPAFAGKPGTGG